MSSREVRSYRTRAIVLGHIEFGEADRILKLFTYERGKITAIAKGIRKIRSRKAGHLEPFTHVNLFLAKGRNLDIITQAETVQAFLGIREDLQRVGLASYVVELLDRFTYEEGQHIGLFRLLEETLARLERQENLPTVVHFYEIRLLELIGFRPQLFECIDCGKRIQEQDQFFTPLGGGAVCPKCGPSRPEAIPVKKDVLRYLRHFQRSKWQQVANLTIPEGVEDELKALMEPYLTYLLERKLNTPEFLREIHAHRKNDPQDGDMRS